MGQKIRLDDIELDAEALSSQGKATLLSLQFASNRLDELGNMTALLQRAKNSYVDSLKKEMLSQKAGIIIDDQKG